MDPQQNYSCPWTHQTAMPFMKRTGVLLQNESIDEHDISNGTSNTIVIGEQSPLNSGPWSSGVIR